MRQFYSLVFRLFLLCIFFAGQAMGQDISQQIVPGRFNGKAAQQQPYVILISADGFRYDYATRYNARHLLDLSSVGVTAKSMEPAFPSLTFPNHYTLITGLYPGHHGLVDNSFWDPRRQSRYSMYNKKTVGDGSWYGGIPLWVLAEQQQMVTASFYWVGSEADIKGVRPTYYYNYNEKISMDERIAVVKNWLQLPADKRPHLITFYMPEVDHEGHDHGPYSKEVEEAVHFVDASVAKLQDMLDSLKLPVNVVFLSDHGMAQVDTVNTLPLPVVDTTRLNMQPSDVLIHIFARDTTDKEYITQAYAKLKAEAKDYDVYLNAQLPGRWNYGGVDDRYKRAGDIVVVPRFPKIFAWGNKRIYPGRHGFDPRKVKDMHATFMAWGPAFKQGKQIGSFPNVQVYGLVAGLLNLDINGPTDTNRKLFRKTVRKTVGRGPYDPEPSTLYDKLLLPEPK
ncbi:MAG: ectonucleotide pyrophosphatase/phosphodiesterase [Candidatus Pseudobacter hemicellulosilyticus]|uniref:Ectonucleotide pyrophosphatase/phosphodiesterase n=1 Tax=Candidatus Pseudobacter hemicellulosilyticus TaxID=3121375 RepID=A0AAJ5WN71_9BACT|nr:MAG: ectonucleotide pyrophosphatase/phosphodiesterase [Pseudobacter sp.]